MTVRPEILDHGAAGSGAIVSVYNFVLGGSLNLMLGSAVGLLSLVVLTQRYRINRRELKKKHGESSD
jgi:hypothetical protein